MNKKDIESLLEIIQFYLEWYHDQSDYVSQYAKRRYDELWKLLYEKKD